MQLLLIVLTTTTLISTAPKDTPGSVHVLLVTGVDHPAHDWKKTAPALREVLEEDKRILVRIVEDPELLATDVIFDYDVLVLHFMNDKPLTRELQARANLMKFVREGKGLVALHFACGAFEGWPEFGELIGKVWDRKTGHDPRGPFTVEIANSQHPITRGMRDFQTNDELYICLVGKRPIELLATARSKVTNKDHPMAFAFQYGNGRVFHTPLGHDEKAIRIPQTAELIRRGCLWVAKREQP